jgi:hypothetical protein
MSQRELVAARLKKPRPDQTRGVGEAGVTHLYLAGPSSPRNQHTSTGADIRRPAVTSAAYRRRAREHDLLGAIDPLCSVSLLGRMMRDRGGPWRPLR